MEKIMKWRIVSDSSSDLKIKDIVSEKVDLITVPFVLHVGDTDYVDYEDLDIPTLLTAMEECATASRSACPSPQTWAEEFEKADYSIAITISANLSGSLNSAVSAKEIVLAEYPDKKIAVVDSKATGPESAMCIYKMVEWIENGDDFETVVKKAEVFLEETKTSFALCSFDNLVKNGRMSKLTGFVARKLGMWGIGIASDEGTIIIKGKSRGAAKALDVLVEDMQERGFDGDQVDIHHCQNENMAERLRIKIQEHWPDAKITIRPTRGLDSFYAEYKGLIIGFH